MEKEMLNISYVYLHLKADTLEPFYVGKGFGDRAYKKWRNKWWQNIVNKHGYIVEFLATGLSDSEAIKLEIETIAKIGRRDKGKGTLVNLTDGGEGTSNPSEETRAKLRQTWSGRKHTTESKEKMSAASKGKQKSESHRAAISTVQKGRIQSTETIAKRSKSLRGVVHKDKGTHMNDDHKLAIKLSLTGRVPSEEHRKKLSEAAKAAHARKKANKNNCE